MVDSPSDNLLAEFTSVVNAVQCAVVIQGELRARNVALPENRRMNYRIGINLGDVIVDSDRDLWRRGQRDRTSFRVSRKGEASVSQVPFTTRS